VLASLPPETESIVTRTAILDRVTGDLVNLLCDRDDGAITLERLEQQGLFLVPLDAQHQAYRYHQMFAQILRDRLSRRDPATFRQLHCTAARHFSARGRHVEAIHHAVCTDDEELIATVLDEAGGWRLIPEGRMETLAGGLARLSEGMIARYPRLVLARVYRHIKQGEMDAARSSYDAFLKSVQPASLPADLWTEVVLVGDTLSEYEHAPVTLDDLLAKEALIRSLPSNDHLMHASVCESVGAKYCDSGWPERALEPTRQSRSHHRALAGSMANSSRVFRGRIRLAQGRMDEAQATLADAAADIHGALARARPHRQPRGLPGRDPARADEVGEARALLDWALPHMEQSDGWFDVYASGFCTALRIAGPRRRGPVKSWSGCARSRAASPASAGLLSQICEVELLIHAGDVEGATARAREIGLNGLAEAMREETPLYRQIALAASVCLIKLRLAADDALGALSELKYSENWARQHGHGRVLIPLCVLAAHAHRLRGEAGKAIARFDEAVGMAMFQGFIAPFLDCWRFIPNSATSDSRTASAGKTDRFRESFLRRLRKALERHSSHARVPALLSPPELSTLRHLDQGYTNKEIARLLNISPNTVKYRLKSLYEKLHVNSRHDAVRLRASGAFSTCRRESALRSACRRFGQGTESLQSEVAPSPRHFNLHPATAHREIVIMLFRCAMASLSLLVTAAVRRPRRLPPALTRLSHRRSNSADGWMVGLRHLRARPSEGFHNAWQRRLQARRRLGTHGPEVHPGIRGTSRDRTAGRRYAGQHDGRI
jgi:LuxR family maltose regulon positive regulatory protein